MPVDITRAPNEDWGQTPLTILDDMLITEHQDDSSVLNAESIVENFEVFTERKFVVTST